MPKEIVASELKNPICHSDECQIGSFSSEATRCKGDLMAGPGLYVWQHIIWAPPPPPESRRSIGGIKMLHLQIILYVTMHYIGSSPYLLYMN